MDTDAISFGPATLLLGPSGATPTADVGAIGENGVEIEITSEKRDIRQGNPKTIEHSFATAQGVKVSVTGIEWDFNTFQYAIGAGNTSLSASAHTWAFGGDPIVETVAIHIQHYMAKAADTLNFYVWKARAEGTLTLPFGDEEHQFPYSWQAMRSATNWAGASLARDEQLILAVRSMA